MLGVFMSGAGLGSKVIFASAGGGGAVFAPELVREFATKMPQTSLGGGYGMSEMVGIGTRISGDDLVAHPDSVGPANLTVDVEIRYELSHTLAEGDIGEIHLQGWCERATTGGFSMDVCTSRVVCVT